jgi:hypothetical protein
MATGILKVITEKCLDCCCGERKQVKDCTVEKCALWPYRNGTNPTRKKRTMSEEKRAEIGERLKAARKVKEPAKKGTITKTVAKKAVKAVAEKRKK